MRIIVDRKEGLYFIVELPDGRMIEMPEELLPGAKEGMVFDITRNEEVEEERKGQISALFQKLKKKK